jgi:heat shock protein HslJ
MPFEVLYPSGKVPTLVFEKDNITMVKGTTGYNTISCPVKISGTGMAFSDCTSTNLACEGPGESVYMGNLKNVNHYRLLNDNTLVVVTNDNKVMRFTRL